MNYTFLFYVTICVILYFLIMKWFYYLSINEYIMECFENNNHTVNLPLTTSYSCNNLCGPTSRCSITGQQCLSDSDCPGCKQKLPNLQKSNEPIPKPNDNAGKLTAGITPTYSPLTSGYGTHELIVTKNINSKPPKLTFGVNIWTKDFEESKKLFEKRYKPPQLPNIPDYLKRYSLTGEFIEDGPYASNAPLPKVK